MTDLKTLSREDLVQMAKMNFHLLAEAMAELARTSPDGGCSFRLSTELEGVHVPGALAAETHAARNDY